MDRVVNTCGRCKKDFKAKAEYNFCYSCVTFYKDTYKWKNCDSCEDSFRMTKDKDYTTCYPCRSSPQSPQLD